MNGTAAIRYRDEAAFRCDPLRWAWAIGATYNIYHEVPVDLPLDADTAARDYPDSVAAARNCLPRDWNVEDRASLSAMLIWLGREGHRRRHRALVRRLCALPSQAWTHYESGDRERAESGDVEARQRLWRMWAVDRDFMQCRAARFLAFDAARAGQLVRNGFALGYLDERELHGFLYDLAREVSATFASWEAFAHDFALGRAFFAGEDDPDVWAPVLNDLLSNPRSPWTRMPFAFPEDDASRDISSADSRTGPYWTLETALRRQSWPAA